MLFQDSLENVHLTIYDVIDVISFIHDQYMYELCLTDERTSNYMRMHSVKSDYSWPSNENHFGLTSVNYFTKTTRALFMAKFRALCALHVGSDVQTRSIYICMLNRQCPIAEVALAI